MNSLTPKEMGEKKQKLNKDLQILSEWSIDWTFLRLQDMRKLKRIMEKKWKEGAKNSE